MPTIQPAPPDKGALHPAPSPSRASPAPSASPRPKGNTHASAAASSSSSTTDTISELTSSSSRDSLPAAHARGGPSTAPAANTAPTALTTTPQKQTRSYRRTKSTKAAARWSDAAPQPKHPPPAAHSSPSGIQHQHPAQPRFMATAFGGPSGDSRRGVSSPRPKGREAKNTFCRNVTIYGHCRYENSKSRPPRPPRPPSER